MHLATPLLLLAGALLAAAEHSPRVRSHKGLLRRFGAAQAQARGAEEAGSSLDARSELSRRSFHGRATYYAAGLGACGTTNVASDRIIAINPSQYDGSCYKTITISYGGKTATAQVTDLCPGCPYGGIDMSQGLFEYFADTSVGVLQVEWAFGNSLDDAPKTTSARKSSASRPPPPSTTSTHSSTRTSSSSTSSSSTPAPSSSSSSSSSSDAPESSTSSADTQASAPVSNFDGLGRVVGVMFDMANAGQEGESASAPAST